MISEKSSRRRLIESSRTYELGAHQPSKPIVISSINCEYRIFRICISYPLTESKWSMHTQYSTPVSVAVLARPRKSLPPVHTAPAHRPLQVTRNHPADQLPRTYIYLVSKGRTAVVYKTSMTLAKKSFSPAESSSSLVLSWTITSILLNSDHKLLP